MTYRRSRSALRYVLSLAVLVAPLIAPSPAGASRTCLHFEFVKNTPKNSTLKWWRFNNDPDRPLCNQVSSWRAGSGRMKDGCEIGAGWLPNGWYDLWNHSHSWGGKDIKGRVWYLQDKKCNPDKGETLNWRTALFIHTEETDSNGQQCLLNSDYDDEPWCWDKHGWTEANPNGTGDYESEGCIKIRRQTPEGPWANDMGHVHSRWHDFTSDSTTRRNDFIHVFGGG